MSAAWNNLLDAAATIAGVRAAAVVSPQRRAITRVNEGLDENLLAAVWRHVSDATDVSLHHRLSPQQMRWIFADVLVYCIRRADGWLLALIVSRGARGDLDPAASRLFEEFRMTRDAA